MKITTIIVTCNRLELLPRALRSVKNQNRQADYVFIISNSNNENYLIEQELVSEFGFTIIKNNRTQNNTGALNTGIVEIINEIGINKEMYVALLDDDDEWLPDYLITLQQENNNSYDVLISELSRINGKSNSVQSLPKTLNIDSFLKGNPGIGNSNTFIKLTSLLKAGCFDEACISNVDRDLFIRLFQLKPTYKVINKHLVNHYTDN
ncbi:MAG: glycosyltransferase family A protein, partial [Bacteroidetes bacterium]|nr:glycosyltransferase family A protein [Bacteroidota bacterium]